MNKITYTILLLITGIILIASVFITYQDSKAKVLFWAFLSIMGLIGWEYIFYYKLGSKEVRNSKLKRKEEIK